MCAAPLNPDHTHFILVDSSKENADGPPWGAEIKLRAALEDYLQATKALPIVQLMVQGGPGTVGTVRATVEAGNPVVVLYDSGGAAEALYQYVILGEVMDAFTKQEESLKVIRDLYVASHNTLLTFFRLDSGKDMSNALLSAILKHNAQSHSKQLTIGALGLAHSNSSIEDMGAEQDRVIGKMLCACRIEFCSWHESVCFCFCLPLRTQLLSMSQAASVFACCFELSCLVLNVEFRVWLRSCTGGWPSIGIGRRSCENCFWISGAKLGSQSR